MLRLRDRVWQTGGKTYIMGILNVTPDSFSDGGRYSDTPAAINHACEMMRAGADIIDVGGQSTRPGHTPIGADEELERILGVVSALGKAGIPFSVDTFFPSVALAALDAGALMINDVSGGVTAEMAAAVNRYGAAWVLMCAGDMTGSSDICGDVKRRLTELADRAAEFNVDRERVCLDPGIGFGKTNAQSIELIKRTAEVKPEGYAYLVAASRKRCIGEWSGISDPEKRDVATAEADDFAIAGGADIIRVHNVALARKYADRADKRFRG